MEILELFSIGKSHGPDPRRMDQSECSCPRWTGWWSGHGRGGTPDSPAVAEEEGGDEVKP
jgi:hypothetical protein